MFGYNVEALLITLAGLLVSFAFMISSASSKYVEVRDTLILCQSHSLFRVFQLLNRHLTTHFHFYSLSFTTLVGYTSHSNSETV